MSCNKSEGCKLLFSFFPRRTLSSNLTYIFCPVLQNYHFLTAIYCNCKGNSIECNCPMSNSEAAVRKVIRKLETNKLKFVALRKYREVPTLQASLTFVNGEKSIVNRLC